MSNYKIINMIKLKFITMIAILAFALGANAQSQDTKAIKKVITAFAKAGDQNDAEKLGSYLDDNFRIVMNRLFGSDKVSILPKSVYLQKIKSKEFGGDDRDISFENFLVNGTSASAKVVLKGKKMTFVSLITLVKDKNDDWKLVSDTPMVQ